MCDLCNNPDSQSTSDDNALEGGYHSFGLFDPEAAMLKAVASATALKKAAATTAEEDGT
jgi:hypothetical protein